MNQRVYQVEYDEKSFIKMKSNSDSIDQLIIEINKILFERLNIKKDDPVLFYFLEEKKYILSDWSIFLEDIGNQKMINLKIANKQDQNVGFFKSVIKHKI